MGQPVRLGLYKLVTLDLPKSELVSGLQTRAEILQAAASPDSLEAWTVKATPVQDFFGDSRMRFTN